MSTFIILFNFFILGKLAAYACSFPSMPTIHTQIRALVLQAFLGAALRGSNNITV